jgi:hypothetical protein
LLAVGRLDDAKARFADYEKLVAECQSPRFAREAERLRTLF